MKTRPCPLLSLVPLLVFACGPEGAEIESVSGEPSQAIVLENIFFAPIILDGEEGPWVAIDTGAPIAVVEPSRGDRPRLETIQRVEALGATYRDMNVLYDILISGTVGDIRVGGIVGCPLLCSAAVSFDYRQETIGVDLGGLPENLRPEVDIAVSVLGGGSGRWPLLNDIVDIPRSRAMVVMVLEGRSLRLMVDTGASFTMIREAAATSLLADGRSTTEFLIGGMFGSGIAEGFRVHDMHMEGEPDATSVPEAIVAFAPGVETLFDQLEDETGDRVDGVLGGTYLRYFHVRMDYPESRLGLARYDEIDHVADEGRRIGLRFNPLTESTIFVGGVPVEIVVEGSDAESQGVSSADIILSIAGESVDGMRPDEVDARFRGELGETISVEFGCPLGDECGSFVGTREIVVDVDLMALR